MAEVDIAKYVSLMKEIKLRIDVIFFFMRGGGHALYEPTTIESMCLQVRKILELIAMASLVANKAAYSRVYNDFAKTWNAKFLLRQLKEVNPDFYPEPIVETPSDQAGVKMEWADRAQDYLSQREFVKVYEKCGAIMHWGNPFGSQVDYVYYKKQLPVWCQRIMNLLNSHQIRLAGDDRIFLIHMKEEGDDEIHYYVFEPTEDA